MAKFGGGGTNCSLPLAKVNHSMRDRKFVGCVLISDMESWIGTGRHGSTAVVTDWQQFVENQARLAPRSVGLQRPRPKLVCVDLQAYPTTQAPDRDDILNIGGSK